MIVETLREGEPSRSYSHGGRGGVAVTNREAPEVWRKGVEKKYSGFSLVHPLMTCRYSIDRLQWKPGSRGTRVMQCALVSCWSPEKSKEEKGEKIWGKWGQGKYNQY